jgi:hypothetical protein
MEYKKYNFFLIKKKMMLLLLLMIMMNKHNNIKIDFLDLFFFNIYFVVVFFFVENIKIITKMKNETQAKIKTITTLLI